MNDKLQSGEQQPQMAWRLRLGLTILVILVVSSFLVLGGEFWDKVRALFIHDAVAQMR